MSLYKKIFLILLDFAETFAIAFGIFVVIYFFLFRPFQVNGESMFPNFQNEEYVLTNLISLRLFKLQRGDIIVFQAPPNAEKDYIKRVIGLPGERIALKDGKVLIDGQILDENSYLSPSVKTEGRHFLADNQEVTIPNNDYFVMGDNREFSSDSREWGFVSVDKIIGKSLLVYWPIDKLRLVAKTTY